MQINDWQIWHSYGTHFVGGAYRDLDSVAECLIRSGVAELAFRPPGRIWYGGPGESVEADMGLRKTPNRGSSRFTVPPELSEFAAECAYQAAFMRTQELHLLPDSGSLLPDYVRAFLPPCTLRAGDDALRIYPQLKLYANGVLLTHLRTFSGDSPVPHAEFLKRYIMAFDRLGEDLLVPRALFAVCLRDRLCRTTRGLHSRISSVELSESIEHRLTELDEEVSEELGTWPVISLAGFPSDEVLGTPHAATLRSLASMIETAVLAAWSPLRRGPLSLLIGSGRNLARTGDRWSGRPSVHLIDFEDRPTTADEISPNTLSSLAEIMQMTAGAGSVESPEEALGRDYRVFPDYMVHQSKAMTLWVSTDSEFDPGRVFPDSDTQNAHVLPKQVTTEAVEYLRATARLIQQRAQSRGSTIREVIDDERHLLQLEQSIGEVSTFGEISDFLRAGDSALELEAVRSRTREALRLKTLELDETRSVMVGRFSRLTAILFGLLGAETVQGSVLGPALRLLDVQLAEDANADRLIGFAVSALALSVLIALVYGLAFVSARRWKRRIG